MKYLQMLNLTLAAVAATFAVVLAVVAIFYGFYLDQSTAVARQFPALLKLVGLFTAAMLVAGAAWWSRWKMKSWASEMQIAAAFSWLGFGWAIATLLGLTA